MFMTEKVPKVKSHSSETHTQTGNTSWSNSLSRQFFYKVGAETQIHLLSFWEMCKISHIINHSLLIYLL